jgi:hypothetical protein
MYQRIGLIGLSILAVAGLLAACSTGPDFVAKDEPWRAQEEIACLSSGVVRESAFLRSRSALGGPSVCGAEKPFEMSAAGDGRVALQPSAMLRCPMVPQVNRWVTDVVEPAARFHLRTDLVALKVAASYSCRPMNNLSGGKLSEHGHANAMDVAAFVMADGRTVTIKGGWNGASDEQGFLRQVRAQSCQNFTTVLGPGADPYHGDHFHLDLARHGKDGLGRICK